MSMIDENDINIVLGDFNFDAVTECDDEDGFHTVWSTEVYDSEGNTSFCYLTLCLNDGYKKRYMIDIDREILSDRETGIKAENLSLEECDRFMREYAYNNHISPERPEKFVITFEENITGEVTVYAEDEEQAERIAKERYKNGEIQLENLVCTQMMMKYEDGTETGWNEIYT